MEMKAEYVSPIPNAKTIVLFGGNEQRRDQVVRLLMELPATSIYGTLSEEEGMQKLAQLKNTDLVLIGGRYTNEQRLRIRALVKENYPATKITEPGYDYPYSNKDILADVKLKLGITG